MTFLLQFEPFWSKGRRHCYIQANNRDEVERWALQNLQSFRGNLFISSVAIEAVLARMKVYTIITCNQDLALYELSVGGVTCYIHASSNQNARSWACTNLSLRLQDQFLSVRKIESTNQIKELVVVKG